MDDAGASLTRRDRNGIMVARDAHQQHPALHADRPDQLVSFNKGVLHRWLFAKNAVAFPRMSRSIVIRAILSRVVLRLYRLRCFGRALPAKLRDKLLIVAPFVE